MFNYRWLFISALCSFQAFAVSMDEKIARVEYLENLSKTATSMNIEAFRRELRYEAEGLPIEKRAENEAQLLAEKIKVQVIEAYEKALAEAGNSQTAADEVKAAIEKDLLLVDESLQEELRGIALTTLDHAEKGEVPAAHDLNLLQQSLLEGVKDRSEYLNHEASHERLELKFDQGLSDTKKLKANYRDSKEIIAELISEEDNVGFAETGSVSLRSNNMVRFDGRINLQIKVEFLGVGVEAGPTISFKRQYNTNFEVVAEGLHPVLGGDGQFDLYKRTRTGNVVYKNGKPEKRKVSFACDASLQFSSEYTGGGGFTIMGVGGGVTSARDYSNSVNMISRRIFVPDSISGKFVDYKTLADLCHNDFLNAKVTSHLTVAGSLNVMMKNIISNLRFSHPKTKCAVDNQCYSWYNREVLGFLKRNNVPRCVEHSKEKYMGCELRGLRGQKCSVYNTRGQRISDGRYEFTCDKGLRCVMVEAPGIFSPALGRCQ